MTASLEMLLAPLLLLRVERLAADTMQKYVACIILPHTAQMVNFYFFTAHFNILPRFTSWFMDCAWDCSNVYLAIQLLKQIMTHRFTAILAHMP